MKVFFLKASFINFQEDENIYRKASVIDEDWTG